MARMARIVMVLALAATIVGCGGGGSSDSGSRGVGIYISDSFRDDYDQVWATIHKVEIIGTAGATQTVYDDPTGLRVNLRTLRDATGARFQLLQYASVQPNSTQRVRVTLAPAMLLAPKGVTTLQTAQLDSSLPKDGQGRVLVEFPLASARDVTAGNGSLVIDFDLANFTIAGGKVRPSLREGERTLLGDRSHHEYHHATGVITHLSGTSPALTFVLQTGSGAVTVVTDQSTAIYNADHSPNAMLAEGQTVTVTGTFDPATHHMMAVEIRIEHSADAHHKAKVIGHPSRIESQAGRFVLSTSQVEGFTPTHTDVHIQTNANTAYLDFSGASITADAFFTSLASAEFASAEGTYDSGSNTLTAVTVKLVPGHHNDEHHDHHVKAAGTLTEPDAHHHTFVIHPVSEWEGFTPNRDRVKVATTGHTKFTNSEGHWVTSDSFYALVTQSAQPGAFRVRVEGTGNADLMTADTVQLTH